jgi:phage-related tail protein
MEANKKLAGTMETRLASIGRRVDRLIESAQSALDQSGEPLQKELERVEEHLSASRAQIRQDLARTRDDFSTAVEDELGIWKGRLEELNLQRALGTMEVRERITPVLEQASIKLDQARRALRDLSEDEFEEGLTKSVKESLVELRSEIATAEELS